MIRPFLLLCALLSHALGVRAQEPAPEERAFIELETARDTFYMLEIYSVTLRIGFDAAFFREHAVQMFQKQFDLPVQVTARVGGWLIPKHAEGQEPVSFVLNGRAVKTGRADDRIKDGRRFTVLEVYWITSAKWLGTRVTPAPELRFQYATEFKEDFLGGRLPVNARDALIKGTPLTIHIRKLPEEGKPPEFSGAVGRFSIKAEAEPREVRVGETLKLVLQIEGDGGQFYAAPHLDDLAGFHVYGKLEEKARKRHTITYDIAPLDATVTKVPAIRFTFFDPGTESYRSAYTQPIPLAVRGGTSKPVEPPPLEERSRGWLLWTGVTISAFAFLLWARSRRQMPAPDPAAAFRARAGRDLAEALTEYLAARLGCPTASVIAPDLGARLTAAGAPPDLAVRAAKLLEALVAARYGGGADTGSATQANALVDALEATFQAAAPAQ